jgi:hypothetical protein
MKPVIRFSSVLATALLMAAFSPGQTTSSKKEYTFHGKVEAVDKSGRSLRVNGEKAEPSTFCQRSILLPILLQENSIDLPKTRLWMGKLFSQANEFA